MNPKFPVYIVSKGRWESRLTSRALEKMRVPYRIVVEPQEFEPYAAVISPSKVLVLPFSNLGQGSIPARNWIWEHSVAEGHRRHWVLDDNISGFRRFWRNERLAVVDGATFAASEEFAERHKNVALAGMQYTLFGMDKVTSCISKPFLLNTRIYSCILIDNALPFRWRGRYNEDTDLSLRVLKAGFCTVLFYAFLCDKQATLSMKGGNTDELYRGDGRLQMAESLRRQHPDVVKIARKWGRWQHQVDYRPFKGNRLILRDGVTIPDAPDEYGMVLRKVAT